MLGERMAEATESEYRLLNAMSDTTQYSLVELVESSGVKRERVGRLLAELIGEGYVTKYELGGRAEYRLSPTGVGKRTMMRGLAKDGPVGWGDFLKAASTAHHQACIAATREQMAEVPLTDYEREAFDGLRLPPLYGEDRPPASHPLEQVVSAVKPVFLALRLLFCLPFFPENDLHHAPPLPNQRATSVNRGDAEPVRQPAVRARAERLRLTDRQRSDCSAALAQQYAIGRLTMDEFITRTDLLYAAMSRADLAKVFEGLPGLVFATAKLPVEPPPAWRSVVFGLAVGIAVPFFLLGLLYLLFPDGQSELRGGAIVCVGALLWSFLAWFWWSSPSRRTRRETRRRSM